MRYCARVIRNKIKYKQVCLQSPPSALNMTLPAFTAERQRLQHGARSQWCIAKNGGGYTQRGVAKGLKVPCLFMITEVSIRCQKNLGGWYTAYTRVYPQYTTARSYRSTSPARRALSSKFASRCSCCRSEVQTDGQTDGRLVVT